MTYLEAVTAKIRASDWYVGDGGFIAQAMNATTLEEATRTEEMIGAESNLGKRFVFHGARFADSDLPGTLPLWALADVVDTETGEIAVMSVGGGRVVATLFRACELGWFPFEGIITDVDLGKGKAAYNLEVAPERVKNTA